MHLLIIIIFFTTQIRDENLKKMKHLDQKKNIYVY
jgi:hypothetical protein